MDKYVPPFTITNTMIFLISEISECIGKLTFFADIDKNLQLRRENQIKTIHASLAIENNTLTIEQVSAIINGKRVLGAPGEIKEVQNAYEAYNLLLDMNPLSIEDMLKAHKIMMSELVKEAGTFRSGGVGVFSGKEVIHMAPPPNLVPLLVGHLFDWYKNSKVHPLIKSCVFHYEFEFIHPFSDGNGRTGRMWQTLLLSKWRELFAWLPIETLVKENQEVYYEALGQADKNADSSVFIEFMLKMILGALNEVVESSNSSEQAGEQVRKTLAFQSKTGENAHSSEQVSEQDGEQVKKTLDDLYEYCHIPHTMSEIQSFLGIKSRPYVKKHYVDVLMNLGRLVHTIPDKPNSSKQQYLSVF